MCESKAGDPNVGWRSTVLGTMVNSSGDAGSGSAESPVLYVPCA
ncbi:hypothetical protein [Streptomyces sp. NPDC091383]